MNLYILKYQWCCIGRSDVIRINDGDSSDSAKDQAPIGKFLRRTFIKSVVPFPHLRNEFRKTGTACRAVCQAICGADPNLSVGSYLYRRYIRAYVHDTDKTPVFRIILEEAVKTRPNPNIASGIQLCYGRMKKPSGHIDGVIQIIHLKAVCGKRMYVQQHDGLIIRQDQQFLP